MSISVACLFDTMASRAVDQNTPHQPGLFLAREFIDALGRWGARVLSCRKRLYELYRLSPSR
jgi:hypothetical protein